MKKISIISILAFCLMIISCRTSQDKADRWEGFTGDKMHIMISEFFMPDEKSPAVIPEQLIKERIEQRASLLLASYININLPREKVSSETDATFNRLINESLAAPKTLLYDCSDNNYCTVITEFDIATVNRELERLKRN